MLVLSFFYVQGPYTRKILEGALSGRKGSCTNGDPKEDFGGPGSVWHGHANPNLTYAAELVKTMGLLCCYSVALVVTMTTNGGKDPTGSMRWLTWSFPSRAGLAE